MAYKFTNKSLVEILNFSEQISHPISGITEVLLKWTEPKLNSKRRVILLENITKIQH